MEVWLGLRSRLGEHVRRMQSASTAKPISRPQMLAIAATSLLPLLGAAACAALLRGNVWYSMSLHSAIEASGSVLALAVAVLLLLQRKYNQIAGHYLWIACGLIVMGVLDLFHAILPTGTAFFWARWIASLAGSIGFSLVLVDPLLKVGKRASVLIPPAVLVATFVLGLYFVLEPGSLPTISESHDVIAGSAKIISVTAGLFYLTASFTLLDRFAKRLGGRTDLIFGLHSLLFATAAFLYPAASPWNSVWWYFHLLRLSSYALVGLYLFLAFKRMHEDLLVSKESLEVQVRDRTQELEAAGRMKDEFLATLSHELRTPLTAILGWSEIIGSPTASPRTVAKGIETISRNARNQNELISDLLDVSRILTGKLVMRTERVDIQTVIQAAVESCQLAARSKSIEVENRSECGDTLVMGDPTRLQQVLWNLISNAIKFTPQGGKVTIQCLKVDHSIEVRVTDTGEGIDASFLPFVFERFRQADASVTRQHGGLGLGLAIVRHIVEAHGGKVAAESGGRGKGTAFSVRLPSLQKEKPHSPVSSQRPEWRPTGALEGLRILVVDDVPDTVDVVDEMLGREGAEVLRGYSAEEAMKVLAVETVDLIISDIAMPGEDGYSLITRIRAKEAATGETHKPAIALSAFARDIDATRSLGAGFDKHLPKPVTAKGLLDAILEVKTEPAQS